MDSLQMRSKQMINQKIGSQQCSGIEAVEIHGGQEENEGLQGLDDNLFKRYGSQKSS
jgi:hypothetical protein